MKLNKKLMYPLAVALLVPALFSCGGNGRQQDEDIEPGDEITTAEKAVEWIGSHCGTTKTVATIGVAWDFSSSNYWYEEAFEAAVRVTYNIAGFDVTQLPSDFTGFNDTALGISTDPSTKEGSKSVTTSNNYVVGQYNETTFKNVFVDYSGRKDSGVSFMKYIISDDGKNLKVKQKMNTKDATEATWYFDENACLIQSTGESQWDKLHVRGYSRVVSIYMYN